MEEENVEVAPSEDNGNVPVDVPVETPSEAPVETETPAEVVEEPAPEPELYELPDGRKVDAETLSRVWKEDFYPEYTRKSQALAAKEVTNNDNKPANPLDDPNYTPENYSELAQRIKEDTLREIEAKEQAKVDARNAVENEVVTQLESLKKLDPNLNENALFLHANKYGFRDLTVAHQNMKDMNELAKTVQQTTAKNIAKRSDPVSVNPGAAGSRPDPSNFSSAVEFMRSLK